MTEVFSDSRYMIRRKVFKLFGGAFHIYDSAGAVTAYCKMKAFKLKEDLRIYRSEEMHEEIIRIAARGVIDFSAAYDVIDSSSGQKIGTLQRRGVKSMLRDEWAILDASDSPIGKIIEDSLAMAILRRVVNIVPQTFNATLRDRVVCRYKQRFNPFVFKLEIDFHPEFRDNKSLLIAGGILLAAIEGRQE